MRTLVLLVWLIALPAMAADKPIFPGPNKDGFLLPNGWTLSPAGNHVITSDLPLNIIPLNEQSACTRGQ